ncbi:MAG TPA: hypothetical protein VMJ92_04410 [Candidatus Limnocylindrales bacterium]|nr:hypothetical protein [Candidatus Limnocylindrales bacterium]
MAGALRPVVILMLLASVLFVVDGVLDGVYPGGPHGSLDAYHGLGGVAYVFAVLNAVVAILIARGSERTLATRIGLSAFFLVERPLSAFVLGPKPPESVVVHVFTGLVELVILVGAVRVWRIGHSYAGADVDALLHIGAAASPQPRPASEAVFAGWRWQPVWRPVVGGLALVLSALLVADGMLSGFVPGGRQWGLSGESTGWVVHAFAAGVLLVGALGVRGSPSALRALLVVAPILFVERVVSPFASGALGTASLVLHALAALAAVGLALAAFGAIRSSERVDRVAEARGA